MTKQRELAIQYFIDHEEGFRKALHELLRIPSISTDSAHKKDVLQAAEWLKTKLDQIGMTRVNVMPTALHPVVFAENLDAGDSAPTVLFYGHYDVQPAEPLDKWQTPPFEPNVRGENLYARGSSDMKGQVMAYVAAVESILQQGELPVNVKFILEGEEEIGSPSIDDFLSTNKGLLGCEVVLNLDAGMLAPDIPTLKYGLRGIASFELRVSGPQQDLHSGSFGGVVHNPAQAISELITGMHDAQGRVTLPGFYDPIPPLSEDERARLSATPNQEDFFLQQTGVPALWGENGYTAAERACARPTLEINGLLSGYTGEGGKTVIPTTSMAKITTRLVSNQDPTEVHQQLKAYLETNAPADITWELDYLGGGLPFIANLDLPQVQAFSMALEQVWGKAPSLGREGGSIPIATAMQQILGADSILSGFGLPDDRTHSPNEKLHLPTWRKGVQAVIHFLYNLREQ
jgi:acetylornithine deacetylase/succinyl-diaminopimelate desuccinylase-like protein